MDKILERDVPDPTKIGFVSFTRAARSEAASRAADRFNIPRHELEASGWFRTLHSCCYRLLGCNKEELIAGSEDDAEWLSSATGERVVSKSGASDWEDLFGQNTDAGKAIFIWSLASNTLSSVECVHDRLRRIDRDLPPVYFIKSFIEKYERAKRYDGRYDFTDLLLRVAGKKMTVDGPRDVGAEGEPPDLPVWFADEWQDCSALQAEVFKRLSQNARWVYLVGDPFQAIYGFAGSDPSIFMNWEHSSNAYRILDKSHRCPAAVWNVGESIIQRAGDYFDRKISPADHPGRVQHGNSEHAPLRIDASQSWLVLARTHFLLSPVCAALERADVPFATTSKNYAAPKWLRGVSALHRLRAGETISSNHWKDALEVVPTCHQGVELLVRGTKTRAKTAEETPPVHIENLVEAGGTAELAAILRSDDWKSLLNDKHRRGACRIAKHGEAKTLNPSIRVGTIHSAKGMEADNVLLVDAITNKVAESMRGGGKDEECRVWYVGATRARRRLVVAPNRRFDAFGVPTPNATIFQGDEFYEPLPIAEPIDAPQPATWEF